MSVRDYLVLFSYKMPLGFRRDKYKFCFHIFTLIAEMCLYLFGCLSQLVYICICSLKDQEKISDEKNLT